MEENQKIRYKLSFDYEKFTSLGKIYNNSPEALKIGRNIHESLNNLPAKIACETLEKVQIKISNDSHLEAIELLKSNVYFIMGLKDKFVLEIIKSINSKSFDPELRQYHLLLTTAYSSHINDRQTAVNYIEILETEFGDTLEEEILIGFDLERALLAIEKGQRSVAVIYNKNVTENKNATARDVAVAYQGLADLASCDEDKAKYSLLSSDKFLEAGNRRGAIANLLVLSRLQGKKSPFLALETLEKCFMLLDSEDLFDRHGKASLLQTKAEYLYRLGQKKEALEIIEDAFELDYGILGGEISLHSSLRMAAQFARELGLDDKSRELTQKAIDVASTIKDELFNLQLKVLDYYLEHERLSEELLKEVFDSCNPSLIGTVLLQESLNCSNTTTESMAFLDEALKYLEEKDLNNLMDLVHFHFGIIYQKQDLYSDAEASYLKSLDANPYNFASAQNLAALYMKNESWLKAEEFFSSRIQLLGELPNICFYYGKVLLNQHKYQLALTYLRKAKLDNHDVKELIEECLEKMDQGKVLINFKPNYALNITSNDILNAIKEFSKTISSSSRMHFWQFNRDKKKYEWISKPEEMAKHLLISFLSAKFGKDNVQIIQEPRAGAGFIDLYVQFAGGLNVVIELKMCGERYSSSYAISGEDQIIHYQDNTGSKLGYLIVFDARKKDFSKGFKELQVVGNKTIYTVAIDVRNNVK